MQGGNTMSGGQMPQAAYRGAHECLMNLDRDVQMYEMQFNKVLDDIQCLISEADTLHRQHEEVVNERQYFEAAAEQAEERIRDTRRIFDRFTVVKDPVVASDGFTYERETIAEYISSIVREGDTPVSYQTKEPLTSLLIPNRSLKTLLSRLEEQLNVPEHAPVCSNGNNNSSISGGAVARPVAVGGANRSIAGDGEGAPHTGGGSAGLVGGVMHGVKDGKSGQVELNALGVRVHPCIRVYGFCTYKDSCAYAKYPYEACLSNLKGKCRFKNQCHERHVEFRGPLNDYSESISEAGQQQQQHQTAKEAAPLTKGEDKR